MATHIFDIDGTLVEYHTSKWLPSALEMLKELYKAGDQIILVTMRGKQDEGTDWSIENTDLLLKDIGIPYTILYSVSSPRYMHDDSKGAFLHHKTNESW